MSEDLTFEPPIELEFENLIREEFHTLGELEKWVVKEEVAWGKIRSAQLTDPYERWRNELFSDLKNLRDSIIQLDQAIRFNQGAPLPRLMNIRQAVANLPRYATNFSTSMISRELIGRTDTDGVAAMLIYLRFAVQGHQISLQALEPNSSGFSINGKDLIAVLARRTLENPEIDGALGARAKYLEETIERFQDQLHALLENHKARFDELLRTHSFSLQSLDELILQQKAIIDDVDARRKRSVEAFKRWLNEVRLSHRDAKQLYTRDLQLSAPSVYWKIRSTRTSWASAAAFTVFVVGAALVFYVGIDSLKVLKSFALGPDGRIQIGAVLLLSPLLVLPIWLFRMIGKVFTTNLAESVDAAQRRVMITTFLALTKDKNSHLSEAERFIILQALFRSSNARDDDEQIPSSLVEALVKGAQGAMK